MHYFRCELEGRRVIQFCSTFDLGLDPEQALAAQWGDDSWSYGVPSADELGELKIKYTLLIDGGISPDNSRVHVVEWLMTLPDFADYVGW